MILEIFIFIIALFALISEVLLQGSANVAYCLLLLILFIVTGYCLLKQKTKWNALRIYHIYCIVLGLSFILKGMPDEHLEIINRFPALQEYVDAPGVISFLYLLICYGLGHAILKKGQDFQPLLLNLLLINQAGAIMSGWAVESVVFCCMLYVLVSISDYQQTKQISEADFVVSICVYTMLVFYNGVFGIIALLIWLRSIVARKYSFLLSGINVVAFALLCYVIILKPPSFLSAIEDAMWKGITGVYGSKYAAYTIMVIAFAIILYRRKIHIPKGDMIFFSLIFYLTIGFLTPELKYNGTLLLIEAIAIMYICCDIDLETENMSWRNYLIIMYGVTLASINGISMLNVQ